MNPWIRSAGAVAAGIFPHCRHFDGYGCGNECDGHFTVGISTHEWFAVYSGFSRPRAFHGYFGLHDLAVGAGSAMRHAWILAAIGLAAGLACVVANFVIGGNDLATA